MNGVQRDFTFSPHFCMAMSAPRRSGKSYLTRAIIRREYKFHEKIIVVCPSLRFNTDYDEFKSPEWCKVHFVSDPTADIITAIVEQSERVQAIVRDHNAEREPDDEVWYTPRVLLVLDDCIDSALMHFKGVSDKVAERGRHWKLTAIFISQRTSAISKSIRINCDYFLIFAPFAIREVEKFLEEFVPRAARPALMTQLTKVFQTPYQFLLLDNSEKVWTRKLKKSTAEKIVKGEYEFILNDDVVFDPLELHTGKRQREHDVDEEEDEASQEVN